MEIIQSFPIQRRLAFLVKRSCIAYMKSASKPLSQKYESNITKLRAGGEEEKNTL
jgi:hypothetical protein